VTHNLQTSPEQIFRRCPTWSIPITAASNRPTRTCVKRPLHPDANDLRQIAPSGLVFRIEHVSLRHVTAWRIFIVAITCAESPISNALIHFVSQIAEVAVVATTIQNETSGRNVNIQASKMPVQRFAMRDHLSRTERRVCPSSIHDASAEL